MFANPLEELDDEDKAILAEIKKLKNEIKKIQEKCRHNETFLDHNRICMICGKILK